MIVVAIKRADGQVDFPPSGDEILAPGDSVVILGGRDNLDQFRQQFVAEVIAVGTTPAHDESEHPIRRDRAPTSDCDRDASRGDHRLENWKLLRAFL